MFTHYRIIKYEAVDEETMIAQLAASLPTGAREVRSGKLMLTVADIDPDDFTSVHFCRDRMYRLLAKIERRARP